MSLIVRNDGKRGSLSLIFRFFFLLIVSACFKGCAPLKREESIAKVTQTTGLSYAVERARKMPIFCSGEWPSNQWWALFKDPQLDAMMQIAIQDSPDIRAAAARLKASIELAKKERGLFFPKLEGTFEILERHFSHNEFPSLLSSVIPRSLNQIHLDLNFNYEIDFFGKNRSTYQAALGVAKAKAAELSQSFLVVTISLAQAYIQYATFLKKLEINQNLAHFQTIYLELIEERWKKGLENTLTVNRAKSFVLKARRRVLECEKEVQIAISQLKILMGELIDTPKTINLPILSFDHPFSLPETLPLNLLARRPDLMAQISKVEAAACAIKGAKAAFFPNVNLKALAGLHSLSWKDLFSLKSLSALIYPAIHLPLFAGGGLQATLDGSVAQYEANVWEYNGLVLKAAKEVADSIQRLETVTEARKIATRICLYAQNASETTRLRNEKGIDSYLSVLDQNIHLMEKRLEEVDAEEKHLIAILFLIKALGGGYEK